MRIISFLWVLGRTGLASYEKREAMDEMFSFCCLVGLRLVGLAIGGCLNCSLEQVCPFFLAALEQLVSSWLGLSSDCCQDRTPIGAWPSHLSTGWDGQSMEKAHHEA